MTCPTAFSYEEAAALWHELQSARTEVKRLTADIQTERCNTRYSMADREEDHAKREALKADIAGLRAERDFARNALAEADAAAREARAERDRALTLLGVVRGVVALWEGGE